MTAFSDHTTNHSAEEEHQHLQSPPPGPEPQSSAQSLLPTAISAAVPWWVVEIYERGGPTSDDWTRLQALGRLLSERGDQLLFRSARKGETAEVFNALAEALAMLSFLPGGVPFGDQRFDAREILTSLLGEERANQYFVELRRRRTE